MTEQPRPGEMHEVDEAFYRLAIKERNFERVKVDRLQAEVDRLREQLTLQSDAYAICQGERGHLLRALRDARNAFVALQQRRDFGITRNAIAKIDRVLG